MQRGGRAVPNQSNVCVCVCARARPVPLWLVPPGCILGEMLGRKPLFKGASTREQLELVIAKLGTPTTSDLRQVSRGAAQSVRNMPVKEPVPWNGEWGVLKVDNVVLSYRSTPPTTICALCGRYLSIHGATCCCGAARLHLYFVCVLSSPALLWPQSCFLPPRRLRMTCCPRCSPLISKRASAWM